MLLLTILLASTIWSWAQSPLLPPASVFKPLERKFFVTAYRDDLESGPSDEVVVTNRFPLTLVWDAPTNQPVDGYRVYMAVLNRTQVFDAGPATHFTIAPTNQPSAPLRLRIAVEGTNFIAEPAGRARFYRSMIQTSTNLVDWDFMAGLKTTSGKEP